MIPSISPRFGNAVLAAAKKHVQKQKTDNALRNAEIAAETQEKEALIKGALQKIGYEPSLDRDTKILIEETLISWKEFPKRNSVELLKSFIYWEHLPRKEPVELRSAIQSTLSPKEIYELGRYFTEDKNRTRNQIHLPTLT